MPLTFTEYYSEFRERKHRVDHSCVGVCMWQVLTLESQMLQIMKDVITGNFKNWFKCEVTGTKRLIVEEYEK
jgi:hypothetical protein